MGDGGRYQRKACLCHSGVHCSEIIISLVLPFCVTTFCPYIPTSLAYLPRLSEILSWLQAYILAFASCRINYFPVGFRAQGKSPPCLAVLGLVLHYGKLLGCLKI